MREGEHVMKKNINKVTMNFLKRNKFSNKEENTLSLEEKSLLIYMILAGIPFPMIILEETEETKYLVLSGWNAVSTVQQFMRGEFALKSIETLNGMIPENIEGKTFFDFSDELKDEFLDTEMVISVFRYPLQESERAAVINVLNTAQIYNRSNLSPSIGKNVAAPVIDEDHEPESQPEKDLSPIDEQLEDMLKHPFFEKINVNHLTDDIALSLFMVSEDGAISDLSGKKIAEFKNNLEKLPDYKHVLEFLNQAYNEKTTYLKKAHLPMVYVCAQKALNLNLSPEKFKEIIDAFFASNNPAYKKAGDSGTATKTNVNIRIKLMLEFFINNV